MPGQNDRQYWVETLTRISSPVLTALRDRQLRARMPVELKVPGRENYTYLEALGRTLLGVAPWVEQGNDGSREGRLRSEYACLAREAIDAATDPESPDQMNFLKGDQPIVDAAFMAQSLLRAPHELLDSLDSRVRRNLADAMKETRRNKKPYFCNWLLFSAVIEALLRRLGEDWDAMRVDFALKQLEQWYCGDGVYADGPVYHWDFYNSIVIHPMLLDLMREFGSCYSDWSALREPILARARRYAAILERSISPEGTYPPIGRSITYRFGVFHLLGQMAWMDALPPDITPAQVRCALTAVIRRTMCFDNFTSDGWLKIGVCGGQPGLGEAYISTGSLYLCTAGLLPLGLSPASPFWSAPDTPWTARKFWNGMDLPADHAL